MWHALTEEIETGRTTRFTILLEDDVLSYEHVIRALRDDDAFRRFFSETLGASPYSAFFWEARPVTTATLGSAFEFVLVDSPALAGVSADPRPFERVFAAANGRRDVINFVNFGHDALLIAPLALSRNEHYPHLAAFVRGAPVGQQQALWAAVGSALTDRVGAVPLWLSTSGLGVYWLHIRLDSVPKYYTHAPYRGFARPDDA